MMMGTAWINYALVWYLLEQLELLSQSQRSLSLFGPLPEGHKGGSGWKQAFFWGKKIKIKNIEIKESKEV